MPKPQCMLIKFGPRLDRKSHYSMNSLMPPNNHRPWLHCYSTTEWCSSTLRSCTYNILHCTLRHQLVRRMMTFKAACIVWGLTQLWVIEFPILISIIIAEMYLRIAMALKVFPPPHVMWLPCYVERCLGLSHYSIGREGRLNLWHDMNEYEWPKTQCSHKLGAGMVDLLIAAPLGFPDRLWQTSGAVGGFLINACFVVRCIS